MTELRAIGVAKRFGGIRALDGVDFHVRGGELVAVCGENGAGKSTLMKILAGIHRPDAGQLEMDGVRIELESVRSAQSHGIALIHQELELCDNLTVAENVGLGDEPRHFAFVDRRRLEETARLALTRLGLEIDPRTPLGDLTIGHRQMVEIAKALARRARVLILDEPTSSLSRAEADRLFDVLDGLRDEGTAIVYISHRLSEIRRLADRVVVLRDGQLAGTLDHDEIEVDRLLTLMIGEPLEAHVRDASRRSGDEAALSLENVSTSSWPRATVSFSVAHGEVLGIAGLVGAGRTELLRAIFGIDTREGVVRVDGVAVPTARPRAMQRAGVAFLPEDRKFEGLLLEASVLDNLTLSALPRWSRFGFVDRTACARAAAEIVDELRIKCDYFERPVGELSGGNQQKVVLGKALLQDPNVLLLDEPTRGIDVGAKQEIWTRIRGLADQGLAVVFVSSEFEELTALADRVAVLSRGNLVAMLSHAELDETTLLDLAAGSRIRA
ncbi:MAG: sugar ABC transporter ATP-binding protein [Planctomycetes bacterium]|nr:sugar ABC transporter ATP-binding protein [Planctomycetota bacterium]MCB9917953.1 sugar ABC transporter ATP-binding protein [Planctomycetota bacterium]